MLLLKNVRIVQLELILAKLPIHVKKSKVIIAQALDMKISMEFVSVDSRNRSGMVILANHASPLVTSILILFNV